jgi:hypothetical protein
VIDSKCRDREKFTSNIRLFGLKSNKRRESLEMKDSVLTGPRQSANSGRSP